MASTAWKTRPPLYCEVECYLRKRIESPDKLHGGITSFCICTDLMMSRDLGDGFRSGFSMSQLHSWRIIHKWWINGILARALQHGDDPNNDHLGSSIMDACYDSREGASMAGLWQWQKDFVNKDSHEAQSGKPFNVLQLQEWRWYCSFTYADKGSPNQKCK